MCHFVVVVIVLFCAIKLQITIINRHQWVLVLSTRLPSLGSSSDSTCSHARITPSSMLGMSKCEMVFDFKLGRSTSDHNNIGSLNFSRFISNAFIHNLDCNGHELQLSSWRLRRRAAVSLTHACHRTYPFRVCRGLPDCLFRMHPAQFLIASCAPVLLDFGVPDVSLGNVSDTVRMTFGLEPNVRCHDNAESDKERKTTVRVQRARENKRLSAHRSATSVGIKLTILCDSQKHITCLDSHCNACLKHFNSSIDQNQRNVRDEDLLFVCLPPLFCPSRTSSATHDHSHGDMGITLEAHVCSRELT